MSFSLRWVGRGGLCRMKQVFSGVLKEMVHKLWRVCVRRSILPLLSTETCLWSTLLTCCCTTACMTRPMSCCNRPYGSTAQRYNGDRWTPHISSSKPVWMSLFCWTQRKIYWRMWETEQFWGTIDFHSIFFPSMVPQNSLVTNFLQNIFLCVQQNKDIQTGFEIIEGE